MNCRLGPRHVNRNRNENLGTFHMDMLTLAGIAMLALWVAGAFFLEAPGIIHLFLTLGVFFVIFGAIQRSARARKR